MMQEIEEHRKLWTELWWNMADGDPLRYKEIKRMDAVKEFWVFYDHWKKATERKIEQIKKQNNANKRK